MSFLDVSIAGIPGLQRRLKAISDFSDDMRELGLIAVGEEKRLAAVKTGNMRRQIHIGKITAKSVETVAGANYSGAVEFGTRPHEIRPRNKKALRFKGRGGITFAKRIHHPGTRAQPFMVPGAERAIERYRFSRVIDRWNRAA